jgi:hypothetical protein
MKTRRLLAMGFALLGVWVLAVMFVSPFNKAWQQEGASRLFIIVFGASTIVYPLYYERIYIPLAIKVTQKLTKPGPGRPRLYIGFSFALVLATLVALFIYGNSVLN